MNVTTMWRSLEVAIEIEAGQIVCNTLEDELVLLLRARKLISPEIFRLSQFTGSFGYVKRNEIERLGRTFSCG